MAKPAFLIALLLLGCQQEPPAVATVATKLTDGSSFEEQQGDFDTPSAERCWPDGRCLAAWTGLAFPVHVSATRNGNAGAYTCSTDHGQNTENVANADGKPIASKRSGALSGGKPWTPAEVRKLTAANSGGAFYFDCLSIAERIEAGSLATLGSSVITQRDLPVWP